MKLSCAVALTGPGEEADGRRTGWREIVGEVAAVEVGSGSGDGPAVEVAGGLPKCQLRGVGALRFTSSASAGWMQRLGRGTYLLIFRLPDTQVPVLVLTRWTYAGVDSRSEGLLRTSSG